MKSLPVLLAVSLLSLGAPAPGQADPGQVDPDQTDPVQGVARPLRESERRRLPLPSPADIAADPDAHAALLAEHGVLLDLEERSVSARAGVIHDRQSLGYPIEYLIVTDRGRMHESLFAVKVRPALLNACLLALGLEAGSGMRWEYTDEDPEKLAWMTWPAHGPLVDIRVSWTDDDGAPHDVSLESMLIDLGNHEPLEGQGWIFVGSRISRIKRGRDKYEEHFMADLEGNVVAIYLDGRGTCLFERNSLRGVDTPYTINPAEAPGLETPVVITFHPTGEAAPERPGIPGGWGTERDPAWLDTGDEVPADEQPADEVPADEAPAEGDQGQR